MQFSAHGHYKIWLIERTVYAQLWGSWNEEAALQFEQDFKTKASALTGPWAHMVYLNDWELGTPDMLPIIERLVKWCIDNGLQRAANIYLPSTLKSDLLNKMIVQQQGDFIRAVFDNPQDGAAWLTEQGYHSTVGNYQATESF